MKLQFLQYMSTSSVRELEYRDEVEYKKLRPTNKHLKEVAYHKNMQPTGGAATSATAKGGDPS